MTNLFIKIRPKPAPRPRVTRNGTYNTKEYTQYKKLIQMAYKARNKEQPTEQPIYMKIDFFFAIPKSWSKKKKETAKWHTSRPDTDNLVKSIKDALNGVVYKDDSQVSVLFARKQYAAFDGVKIEIVKMEVNQ